jgi:hypothetical protein
MANFLTQLPALLGVVVGGLGTMLATSVADRARWRREQSVRWDERRLDAYVTYAATIKEIHSIAFRLAAAHRPGSTATPVEPALGLEMLAQANVRRTQALEAVHLLGDAGTVAAAREWQDAVRTVERLARGQSANEAEWAQAVRVVDDARDRFYVLARVNLAVSGEL